MNFLEICTNIIVGSLTVIFAILAIILTVAVVNVFYELFIKD